MNERLRKIRLDHHLTQQAFAERIGIKRNTVSLYEAGKSGISDSVLKFICREFNVNYEWLTCGTGEMYIENDDKAKALIDNLMSGEDEFAKRVFYEFAKLGPDEWKKLKDFIEKLSEDNV